MRERKRENERERKEERESERNCEAGGRGRERERDLKSNVYTSHVSRISARNKRYADKKLIIFLMQHIMFYTYILYILYI